MQTCESHERLLEVIRRRLRGNACRGMFVFWLTAFHRVSRKGFAYTVCGNSCPFCDREERAYEWIEFAQRQLHPEIRQGPFECS